MRSPTLQVVKDVRAIEDGCTFNLWCNWHRECRPLLARSLARLSRPTINPKGATIAQNSMYPQQSRIKDDNDKQCKRNPVIKSVQNATLLVKKSKVGARVVPT
eukprot:5193719-Amphidinium_carterae.2